MKVDRTEAAGFGVALAGHLALLAALALGFAVSPTPPQQARPDPIEIDFVTEEVAVESSAPTPSAEAPAPLLAPIEGPPDPAPAPAEPTPAPRVPQPAPVQRVEPVPQPRVTPTPPPPTPMPKAVQRPAPPQPAPKVVQRPAPAPPTPAPKAVQRPAPAPRAVQRPQPAQPAPSTAKAAQPKAAGPSSAAPKGAAPKAAAPAQTAQKSGSGPTGRLKGLLNGLSGRETPSQSASPPAAKAGPAVAASLGAEVRRQLKPHWRAPTGADVELLRTTVRVSLSRSGAIADIGAVTTTGQNASNSTQVKLHQEQAIRAVRLAAPFRLPAEYYDEWKEIAPVFDRRL
ncbi:MAG TPA: cell envelope biogenesis protein TolA [Allosphingosinicella sp.]|nr:cell envelope biogenesis protein TolA [Allosphingosinicella sp.]